jgi:alpha-tubulin suppressor-like RCC1 family protein
VPTIVTGVGNLRFVELGQPWMGTTACGIERSGQAYCWGGGFLGDGAPHTSPGQPPKAVPGAGSTVSIAGNANSCLVSSSGTVSCWGSGLVLGMTSTGPSSSTTPVAMGSGFASVSIWQPTACALKPDGGLYCWGDNRWKVASPLLTGCPVGGAYLECLLTPTRYPGVPPMASVVVVNAHACGMSTGGDVYCWGSNNGRLGSGTMNSDLLPATLVKGGIRWMVPSP